MKLLRKRVGLIHGVENMHAYDTVEALGGEAVRLGQVGDDRGARVHRSQIEDVYS
jgi:hypothetical protein